MSTIEFPPKLDTYRDELAKVIRDSSDGDVIICQTEVMKELVLRAAERLGKKVVVELAVEPEDMSFKPITTYIEHRDVEIASYIMQRVTDWREITMRWSFDEI